MSRKIRVAINGFGRIGRLVFRVLRQRTDRFEVVAINDLGTPEQMAMLVKYDSTHGKLGEEVRAEGDKLIVGGDAVRMLQMKVSPKDLPWDEYKVDLVVESTGVFRAQEQVEGHFSGPANGGVKRALLSVPPKGASDPETAAIIVKGVNDATLKPSHRVVSNASCTTNCLAPLAKVLDEAFGIEYGLMTTVHGYTNGQSILDLLHKDPRRARTAAQNIIPTTTGAALAVGKVLPHLAGKLDGMAMRVPVPDGSIVDLVAELRDLPADKKKAVAAVNAAVKAAAEGPLKGILEYTEDPIVSSDVIGNPHSSVFDAQATMVMEGTKMVKVLSWYDNEWGYSNRCVDLLELMAAL